MENKLFDPTRLILILPKKIQISLIQLRTGIHYW